MLPKKVEEALNKQIGYEAYACSSYLAIASWCQREGMRGATNFFYKQSDEERVHMLKIVKYINEAGGHAIVQGIKEPPAEYKNIKEITEISLAQEQDVTKQIYKLVDISLSLKDYATYNFMQWYVSEQLEEESLFNTILNIIKMAGKHDGADLLIDNELTKIRDEEDDEEDE